MNVYVFKTSVNNKDVNRACAILQRIIPDKTWNFDLDDCDNILRVESDKNIIRLVCFHLESEGFSCEELS